MELNQVGILNVYSRYNSLIGFDIYNGPGINVVIRESHFDSISMCGSVLNSEITSPQSDLVSFKLASLFNSPPAVEGAQNSSILIDSSTFMRFGLDMEMSARNLFVTNYNNAEFG